MTVDLEDWFQVENFKTQINPNDWVSYEYRIEKNTDVILSLLDSNNSKATFFSLGWIAKKFPQLVSKIYSCGHEISSHGYNHNLAYNQSKNDFLEDLAITKDLLEDTIGEKVYGFRAPSFSITDQVIEVLQEEKYIYDSSLFPSMFHDRYGKLSKYKKNQSDLYEIGKDFYEIPLSSLNLFGVDLPWAGGGYFRSIPYSIFRLGIHKCLKKNSYYNFYIHPWEFDPEQPRVENLDWNRRFRHYNNLSSTKEKFEKLLKEFQFSRIIDILPEKLVGKK